MICLDERYVLGSLPPNGVAARDGAEVNTPPSPTFFVPLLVSLLVVARAVLLFLELGSEWFGSFSLSWLSTCLDFDGKERGARELGRGAGPEKLLSFRSGPRSRS